MFYAAFRRELQLRWRRPAQLFFPIAIAVLIALIVAFAVGPQPRLLASLAPATLFIGLLLSLFLALDQLFEGDVADGCFDLMVAREAQLLALLYGKACGFCVCNGLAMLLSFPLLMVMLDLPGNLAAVSLFSLFLSCVCLSFLGLAGAALMARLESEQRGAGGSLLQLLLIIPQAVPVLIFGVGAVQARSGGDSPAQALYFLAALALVYVAFAPLAARLAIRAR